MRKRTQKKRGNRSTNWEFETFFENRKRTQKMRKRTQKKGNRPTNKKEETDQQTEYFKLFLETGNGPKKWGNGWKILGNPSKILGNPSTILDPDKPESDLKNEETDKKREIPSKIGFEGFPIIFEKTGNASKNSFWRGFRFFGVRFHVEAFP